jgi:glucosamine--fructose-6-phosphate aminotransferase (isomerizing)
MIRATLSRFPSLEEWIRRMKSLSSMLILGRKKGWIAAMESSLKMKELTRIHTEAYSSGSLKHGPFALLDENMPVLYIHTEDSPMEKTILSLHEILARKSPVFLLAPESIPHFPFFHHPNLHIIFFPTHTCMDFLSPILFVQELSIRISLLKGFSVDFPRNLAKTVTVE